MTMKLSLVHSTVSWRKAMEEFRQFLETTSIAGLTHVSTNKGAVRLFWICVVVSGFIGSGILIRMSFSSWAESPVTTTLETVPIKDLTFPRVTVCPPKDSYTDLNYDLERAKSMTIEKGIREELSLYAMSVLQDYLHADFMANLSKIDESDRFYNWYYGVSLMEFPRRGYQDINYNIHTWARSGNISTQYFGDEFDPAKVERNIRYQVRIYVPENEKNNENFTLEVNITKLSMTDFSDGSLGKFYLDYASQDPHSSSIRRKFTPPCAECKNRNVDSNYREIVLLREIKEEDIQIMNMKQMPGFQVSWFYGEQNDSHLNAATSLDLYQQKSINDTRFIDKFDQRNIVTKEFIR